MMRYGQPLSAVSAKNYFLLFLRKKIYLQPSNVLYNVIQAKVAQLVERNLAKVEVAGSRPVFRSQVVESL